jgi:hypothetical protein
MTRYTGGYPSLENCNYSLLNDKTMGAGGSSLNLATQEAEMGRISLQSQLKQMVCESLS